MTHQEIQDSENFYHLQFHGKLSDYFKIWIVNAFLTVLTLGIYSPWAKVRKMKYMNQATEFRGSRMDYHAEPFPILVGRLIAICLFGLYFMGGNISPVLGIVGLGLIFILAPILFVKSIRFKAKNTSYRNIHFSFRGTIREAYKIWLRYFSFFFITTLLFFINMVFFKETLSAEAIKTTGHVWTQFPVMIQMSIPIINLIYAIKMAPRILNSIYHFIYDHMFFGNTPISIQCDTKSVFKEVVWKCYKLIGLMVIILIGEIALISVMRVFGIGNFGLILLIPLVLLLYLSILYISFLFPYLITTFVWGNLHAGAYRSQINLPKKDFMKIVFTNLFGILFSLGLLIPWAELRFRKLVTEAKSFNVDDLDQFVAASADSTSALSTEILDIFDFDFEVGI